MSSLALLADVAVTSASFSLQQPSQSLSLTRDQSRATTRIAVSLKSSFLGQTAEARHCVASAELRSGITLTRTVKRAGSLRLPRHARVSASLSTEARVAPERLDKQQGQEEAKLRELAQVKGQELRESLKGTSIFLVGMMGSGKSTVGKLLSDLLGYCFFDSDEVVERAAGGMSVAQIFKEHSEEGFREFESQVLAELSSFGRVVVATGGGAVIRPLNWSYLSHGITVYLDVPIDQLAARVVAAGTGSRPLLGNGAAASEQETAYAQAFERLSRLMAQRQHLYASADVTISFKDLAQQTADSPLGITPLRVALQVLEEVDVLVVERRQKDMARAG